MTGHELWVNGAAFSPDGRRIVTASHERTARVWDAARGGEVTLLQLACRALPMVNGQRDLSMGELGAEIGLPNLPDLTPCEDFEPPMPGDIP